MGKQHVEILDDLLGGGKGARKKRCDWCRPVISWNDKKCYGRNKFGPTLKQAYDKWVLSGRAAEVDKHKDSYLGWIQANLS